MTSSICTNKQNVRFEVLIVVLLRIQVVWDVKLCCLMRWFLMFRRSLWLHLQGLACLTLEDEGTTVIQNII